MSDRTRAIVTLLTDFGSADGYAGAVKGVIVSLCPDARIVDLTHDVPAGDVTHGAFALAAAAQTFPRGTIHVAVVDPGVGTERRSVVVEAGGNLFVGPDNGLLALAAQPPRRVYTLDRHEWFRRPVSSTFHGRDVYAPVAAHLASGVTTDQIGTLGHDLAALELTPVRRQGDTVEATVVHVDRFGNLITNLLRADLPAAPERVCIELAGRTIEGLVPSYAFGAAGEPVALIGSGGTLEIAVNRGSAAESLGVVRGATVIVRVRKSC